MEAIVTQLTTSMTEIGTSLTSIVAKTLPIALPIIGAVMVVCIGLKIFKKITAKA